MVRANAGCARAQSIVKAMNPGARTTVGDPCPERQMFMRRRLLTFTSRCGLAKTSIAALGSTTTIHSLATPPSGTCFGDLARLVDAAVLALSRLTPVSDRVADSWLRRALANACLGAPGLAPDSVRGH